MPIPFSLRETSAAPQHRRVQYGSERKHHITGLERDVDSASAVYLVAEIPVVAYRLGGIPGGSADRSDAAFFGVV